MYKEGEKVKKDYTECPEVCQQANKKSFQYPAKNCDACPKIRHWKIFKEETNELWVKWIGEDHKMDFDHLLSTMFKIARLDKIDHNDLSLKNQQLLSVFKTEQRKAKR